MDNERTPLTQRQVRRGLRNLERKGFIEKKRDALGNVVMRPGKDGKPQVVWVATNVTPLRWELN
jgi:predicted ArsR family transcriptional regulator